MAEITNTPPIPANLTQTVEQLKSSTTNPANPSVTSPTTGQSLQLPSTTIIPGLAKDINVGDIINFVMRGRSPDGLGLLYMMGQLVKANVPENIAIGDKVQAKIDRQGERIFFKILNIAPTSFDSNTPYQQIFESLKISLPEKLSNQIAELLTKLNAFLPDQNLHTDAPLRELSTNLSNLTALAETILPNEVVTNAPKNLASNSLNVILKDLQKLFLTDKNVVVGRDIEAQLKSTKITLENSQQLLVKLENFLKSENGSSEIRFFAKLVTELQDIGKLITDDAGKGESSFTVKTRLEKLFRILTSEVESESLGKTTKKNFVYFDSVKLINGGLEELLKNPKEINSKSIEKLVSLVNSLHPGANEIQQGSQLKLEPLRELYALTKTLEQFVAISQMLNQLEPIMNLMKAPELILFPFLFQGFLSFTEVAIDPDAHRQNQKQETKNKRSKIEDGAYRYSTSIQLPNLGLVSVASLQDNKDIDIQINLEDEEKKEFIISKLKDLRVELASSGFNARNITAEAIDISQNVTIE